MSSDKPQQPENNLPKVDWDKVSIWLLKGVVIMTIRSGTVVAIALSLATIVPAVGLAEEPEIMQEVEVHIQAQAEQEGISEEKKGLGAWVGGVVKKAAAGAGDLKDKLLDVDKKMADKVDEQEDTILRLRRELAEAKKAAAESRYTAGVKHEMMLQCGTDLLEYLKQLPKD